MRIELLTASRTLVRFVSRVQDGVPIQVFFSCEPFVALVALEGSDIWFMNITGVHLKTRLTIENLFAKLAPKP